MSTRAKEDDEIRSLLLKLHKDETKELLSELYKDIWGEACRTPRTEETRQFAIRLLPLIEGLNRIFKFRN